MTPEQIEQMRKLLGLDDRPLWQQYLELLAQHLHRRHGRLDLPVPHPGHRGHREPDRLDAAARRHRTGHRRRRRATCSASSRPGGAAASLDSVLPPLLVFIGSFPYFWLAMGALYLFGVVLGWFPLRHAFTRRPDARPSPEFIADVAAHLVLPAATIVLVSIGGWMLGMRNTMIATNSEDYITMAEAKGLRPRADHVPLRRPQRDCCPRSPLRHGASASWSAARCSPRWCSPTPASATSSSRPSTASTTR